MTQQSKPFEIRHQYVKDVSFENYCFWTWADEAPDVDIKIDNAIHKINDDHFNISLQIKINATVQEKTAFILDVLYENIVFVNQEVPDHEKQVLLCIHAPTLLFPFARQLIADITMHGGIPPIVLAPVDFASAFMESQEEKNSQPSGLIH
jgi:preprotein translocase subunit SecB